MSTRVLNSGQFKDVYDSAHASARVGPTGYLHNMVTAHDRRGEGHGTALLEEITAHADELGRDLMLNARPALHGWYGRHGFTATGKEDFGLPRLVRQPREQ